MLWSVPRFTDVSMMGGGGCVQRPNPLVVRFHVAAPGTDISRVRGIR
jgi:hypothetical protein